MTNTANAGEMYVNARRKLNELPVLGIYFQFACNFLLLPVHFWEQNILFKIACITFGELLVLGKSMLSFLWLTQ